MIAEVITEIELRDDFLSGYHYNVPLHLQHKIKIGQRVEIPFGNRKLVGVIIGLEDGEDDNLKNIKNLLDDVSPLNDAMLKLMQEASSYYLSSPYSFYELLVPKYVGMGMHTVVENDRRFFLTPSMIKDKTEVYFSLQKNVSDSMSSLEKKAPKQFEVLSYINKKQFVAKKELKEKFSNVDVFLRKLDEKALIKKQVLLSKDFGDPPPKKYISNDFILTSEQKNALEQIKGNFSQVPPANILLQGVTGSGKTEVYIQTIADVIEAGKQVLFLLPEIGLSHYMLQRLQKTFPDQIALLHSGLADSERRTIWFQAKNGLIPIVIGTRSAVFTSFKNLGLIIIDEEHDSSYKQNSQSPRYHARKIAMLRSKIESVPLVLGSATPDISTRYMADQKQLQQIILNQRTGNASNPNIKIVDLKEKRSQEVFFLSRDLAEALDKNIKEKKQSLIFLNRRGYATYIQCRECGYILKCSDCDVALTYHRRHNKLQCHYCQKEESVLKECPVCHSKELFSSSFGTEQVEKTLQEMHPAAVIKRFDSDSIARHNEFAEEIQDFIDQKADILVGTQLIAKGIDLELITLVGILNGDQSLNVPDYKAVEKSYQLLTQVSGRAGRGKHPGTVYLQTYDPEKEVFKLIQHGNYEDFYHYELERRKVMHYPPFTKMVRILITDYSEHVARKGIEMMYDWFSEEAHQYIDILGPGPAPILRIHNRYRYQLILKSNHLDYLNQTVYQFRKRFQHRAKIPSIRVIIDVDPEVTM